MVSHWAKMVSPDTLACVPGLAILAVWLLRTSLGRASLHDAPIRRNHLPQAAGGTLLALFVWMMPVPLVLSAVKPLVGDWAKWRIDLLANVTMGVSSLVTILVVLAIARMTFARGLKGFGLRPATIPQDTGAALVNLLAIWPLVLAMIAVVLRIGEYRYGPTYQIEQHKELELLTNTHHLSLQVSIVILAVGLAPVVEEMLFRGLVQTTLRSLVERPWPAVFLSSGMFAMVHQNIEHWPALFVLAVGMGYAYEKSGSLWRPIFIHALFNGVTILSNL